MDDQLAAGIRLFNDGHYFEAHELLEDVWRAAPAIDKTFLQGLVQVAVAFHHRSTGNVVGATSVLAKACRNLQGTSTSSVGIDVDGLRAAARDWAASLANSRPLSSRPCIRLASGHSDKQD